MPIEVEWGSARLYDRVEARRTPGAEHKDADHSLSATIGEPGVMLEKINGGADGIRTRGLLTASQARSQLRHSPTSVSVSTRMI